MFGRHTKYGNEVTYVDGIRFPSKLEARRWQELCLLQKAGKITGLARQVRIEIVPKTKLYRAVYYVPDFVYFDKESGKTVYEDTKGKATDVYTLKKKLLYWRHGIEIREVKA